MVAALALALALLPGDLLVEIPAQGTAIARADGGHRVLGGWYDADRAPDGTRIAAAAGETLAALDTRGRVLWRVRAAGRVTGPRWAPDGMRLAYRRESRGATLRVVEAGGGGDRRLARGLGFAAPAWRPGKGYAVAWADRRGRVRLRDVAGGRTLWRTRPAAPVRGLAWSRPGRRSRRGRARARACSTAAPGGSGGRSARAARTVSRPPPSSPPGCCSCATTSWAAGAGC